jgi:hypothetical protein
MPFDQAGLLIFDAHSTHISTRSIQIARFFGFHLLTIPSHCSILLQPLDNFFNGEFCSFYRQMYQDAWVHNRVPRASDKLRSVLRAFRETSKKSSECREAWRRCGIKDGFPSPEALRPEKFFVGQSFRDASCPTVTQDYLRVLFSWENILSQTSDTISGDALEKLLSRAETAEKIREVAMELVQLMATSSSEQTETLSLVLTSSDNGPSSYFLPRVRNTVTHNANLFRSQALLAEASSAEPGPSPEVLKEINSRLSIEIAAGTILTSQSISAFLMLSETAIEQKRAAEQHRASWKESQEPIWKTLLKRSVDQNLVPPTTQLNNRSVLKLETLKSICRKLHIAQSGTQLVVANRLLDHFGLEGRFIAYSPPEGEPEEENELNDD